MSAKKRKEGKQNDPFEDRSVDAAALARLTHQTRDLLAFHLELGISSLPATPILDSFLLEKQLSATIPPLRDETVTEKPAAMAKGAVESTGKQLEIIAGDLSNCRCCAAALGPAVVGQGSASPRLFVVGDYCRVKDAGTGTLWGAQEDELFWKMMAAIGLDRESVYVTNCIKCGRDDASAPDAASGRNCFSFLERELAAMEPGLICTMGELATGQLLGTTAPLVRMRGRFHTYRYPHGGTARVMPTFHPGFLLQHPEMKRAAWMDLQALQRQL